MDAVSNSNCEFLPDASSWSGQLSVCGAMRGGLECASCRVKALSLCSALDPVDLKELDSFSKTSHFEARQHIFEQGQTNDAVFNLTAGAVRLSKLLPDGRRQVVGFALPGDFLGFDLKGEHDFSADALVPVTVCQFPLKRFQQFLSERAPAMQRLYELASHELTMAQEQMMLLGRKTAEERVAAFLAGLRNRWEKINGNKVLVPLPMTRQDIADYLGLTIETVSRMMTRLSREKIIVIVPDGVRLLDVPRLMQLAAV